MLTACLIVRNEAETLPKCLKAVRDFVDEIVIVDTGSVDETCDIALAHRCSLYHFDWVENFSVARNFALSKVTTPWTLTLDADDIILNPHLLPDLMAQAHKQKVSGLWSIYWQDGSSYQRRLQLFKTNSYRWKGVVHETLQPIQPRLTTELSALEVLHAKPVERGPEAAQRYLDILLKKDPTNWLGIAESYRFLKDYARAEEYYWQAFNYPQANAPTKYAALFHMASQHIEMSPQAPVHVRLAIKTSQLGITMEPERAECYVTLAQALYLTGNTEGAIKACNKALECEMPFDDIGIVFRAYYRDIPNELLAKFTA